MNAMRSNEHCGTVGVFGWSMFSKKPARHRLLAYFVVVCFYSSWVSGQMCRDRNKNRRICVEAMPNLPRKDNVNKFRSDDWAYKFTACILYLHNSYTFYVVFRNNKKHYSMQTRSKLKIYFRTSIFLSKPEHKKGRTKTKMRAVLGICMNMTVNGEQKECDVEVTAQHLMRPIRFLRYCESWKKWKSEERAYGR